MPKKTDKKPVKAKKQTVKKVTKAEKPEFIPDEAPIQEPSSIDKELIEFLEVTMKHYAETGQITKHSIIRDTLRKLHQYG